MVIAFTILWEKFMQSEQALFIHQDTLANLHENFPLTEKLRFLHQIIRQDFPFVDRLAIALFDEKTEIRITFRSAPTGSCRRSC